MHKKEIYALLSARDIWHGVTEHKAVYNLNLLEENGTQVTLFDA